MKYTFNLEDDLYHGTLDVYGRSLEQNGIQIIPRSKGGVDFGTGFYLTFGNEAQARVWAEQRAEKPIPNKQALDSLQISVADFMGMRSNFRPCIVKYRITDPDAWMALRKRIFTKDDAEWKRYVWTWRQATQPPQLDWTFGPVADGGLHQESFQSIRAYNDNNQNQVSVHTVDAIRLLELKAVISW